MVTFTGGYDYDFWLRFYKNWEIDKLIAEIDTCHLYQQMCMSNAVFGQSNYDYQLRQLIQSQERVKIIVQAIREKIENGLTENDRQNES